MVSKPALSARRPMRIVPPPTPSSQHAANPATLLARRSARERSTTELIRVVWVPPIPRPASPAADRKSSGSVATARRTIPIARARNIGANATAAPHLS
jgi:hypothetical protein